MFFSTHNTFGVLIPLEEFRVTRASLDSLEDVRTTHVPIRNSNVKTIFGNEKNSTYDAFAFVFD